MNIYQPEKDIVLAEILGEYLLVSLKNGERKRPDIRQINPTGAFIWKMFEQGNELRDIVKALREAYDLYDEAETEKDVFLFAEALCNAGYLRKTVMDENGGN